MYPFDFQEFQAHAPVIGFYLARGCRQCGVFAIVGGHLTHIHKVSPTAVLPQSFFQMCRCIHRWFQGTAYAEKKYGPSVGDDPHAREVLGQIRKIREHRHMGQPYVGFWCSYKRTANGLT